MTESARAAVLCQLASKISAFQPDQPVRVAIDGRTAAGKTTVADELAVAVERSGREVIRTLIDGFHRPRAERYACGRYSPEGYYWDARDLSAVSTFLLDPLGPHGDRRYRTASFDLENDEPLAQEPRLASANAVLIVDGTFLQRDELASGWDLTIFVQTSEHIAELRGVSRDTDKLGGAETARRLYEDRYKPAYSLYERLCAPATKADVILHNEDFDDPRVTFRSGGRLSPVSSGAT